MQQDKHNKLKFSQEVNPVFYATADDRQMLSVMAVVGVDFETKVLVRQAALSARGLSTRDAAKIVVAEMFSEEGSMHSMLGAQNAITNAHGVIYHSDFAQISFLIHKGDFEQSLLGHPRIREFTIDGIGQPSLNPVPTAPRQVLHAGVA